MPAPTSIETAEEVTKLLTDAGYSDVQDLERHGSTWHCTAVDGEGTTVRILVDAKGNIKEKGDEPDPLHPSQLPT